MEVPILFLYISIVKETEMAQVGSYTKTVLTVVVPFPNKGGK